MNRNDDYGDLSALLMSKLQIVENKVDALNQDRVTRSDFENLRKDISNSYVPRDTYEARHAILIERDNQLEMQHKADLKDLRDYIEKNILLREKAIDELEGKIEQQHEIQLSAKDRNWMRITQAVSVLAFIAAVLDWLFQHVKLQ